MGWHNGLQIQLSRADRKQVDGLLSGGVRPVRAVIRALLLRQMDQGLSTVEAGAAVGISAKAAWEIGRRYLEGGLKRAIYDAPTPGQMPLLDAEHGQRIIAMVCGPPPAGRARGTVRLIAEEAVRRKLAGHVSRATVHLLLHSHDLKPWRGKMWCVAELNEEYIRRMEDVLKLYEEPLSEEEPVACIDEKPVVLHRDIRAPLAARRDDWRGAITSTSAAARPRSFAAWSRRRGGTSPSLRPRARRRSLPITCWRSWLATLMPAPLIWSWTI